MDATARFEEHRARLMRIAAGILRDRHEADDIVQQAWLRWRSSSEQVEEPGAWLTTVTTRLCLDRLRSRVPDPVDVAALSEQPADDGTDPAEVVALADSVGVALTIVLEHLTPTERVSFILHDTFGVAFPAVAQVLGISPAAARKLASRARAKVTAQAPAQTPADWEVVDAFLAAARGGDFATLVHLLAPDVAVHADSAAVAAGTPAHLLGRPAVAEMFDGAARAALPMFVQGRPGAAWFHQGQARVAFDFVVHGGAVREITFRATPDILSGLIRRRDADIAEARHPTGHTPGAPLVS